MEVKKYASMQVQKYVSMQVCNYTTMQVCKYTNIQQKVKFKLSFAHKAGILSLCKLSIESKTSFTKVAQFENMA